MAAWTAPRDWAPGELVTAALLDVHVRDNLQYLFDAVTALQAAGLGNGAYTAFTPALQASTTNPSLGTGADRVGRFVQIGEFVQGWASITFGPSGVSAGSGTYRVTLPVAASSTSRVRVVGEGRIIDSSAGTSQLVAVEIPASQTAYVELRLPADVTNAVPWTWAANDVISVAFAYEAA